MKKQKTKKYRVTICVPVFHHKDIRANSEAEAIKKGMLLWDDDEFEESGSAADMILPREGKLYEPSAEEIK